jgi:hypothetical protein
VRIPEAQFGGFLVALRKRHDSPHVAIVREFGQFGQFAEYRLVISEISRGRKNRKCSRPDNLHARYRAHKTLNSDRDHIVPPERAAETRSAACLTP